MTPEDMCDYIPNRERLKAQQRETLSGPLMPAVCTHVHCTSAFDERLYYRDEPQAPEAEAAALPQLLRTWKCVPMNGGVPCESPNEPAQSGAAVSSPTAVSVSTSAAAPDGGASAKMAPLPTGVALDGASSLNTSLATLLYSAPATFERTQGQVKETVIPLICEQLSQLKIPAMEQVGTGSGHSGRGWGGDQSDHNELYHWGNLVGLFLAHKFLGPRTPPPPLYSNG